MKKLLVLTLVFTAVVCSTAFYLFPHVPDTPAKIALAVSFAITVPQLVAIMVFLRSLKAFKRELKIAYYILTVGILFLSFNQLQLPVVSFYTVDPVVLAWFIAGTALAGAMLMYISMYRFTRLLDLQNHPWDWPLVVALLSLLLAVASAFLPHENFGLSESVINGVFGTYIASVGFALAGALLASRIRRKLAPSYRTAMNLLTAALIMLAFSSLHETLIRLLPAFSKPSFSWYTTYNASLWPLFFVSALVLAASFYFRRLSSELGALSEEASHVEVVDYMAQLVSNAQAIDVTLDKVRQVTAVAGTGKLPAAQKATLVDVYLQLEKYLTTKEPLLSLSQSELRSRLPSYFVRELPKKQPALP